MKRWKDRVYVSKDEDDGMIGRIWVVDWDGLGEIDLDLVCFGQDLILERTPEIHGRTKHG